MKNIRVKERIFTIVLIVKDVIHMKFKKLLSDFYAFVKAGIECFFIFILVEAFLLIILLFSNFLAPKKFDVPSENAKVYEIISVKQSKSFWGSIYYAEQEELKRI